MKKKFLFDVDWVFLLIKGDARIKKLVVLHIMVTPRLPWVCLGPIPLTRGLQSSLSKGAEQPYLSRNAH